MSRSARHRPGFHALVLAIGFLVGGLITHICRRFLPAGAPKEFLTSSLSGSVGPLSIDLLMIKFTLGPVAVDISLLGLLGVLVAYLIARSLF
jgi:hypothetical protein